VKPVVFLPHTIGAGGMRLLEAECTCLVYSTDGSKPPPAELKALLARADAVIVRLFSMGPNEFADAPRLKVIAKHGVGVDNIDVAAATARRIPVVITPQANANSVAEHTVTLMLALARNLYPAAAATLAGRFQERDKFEGIELAGRTLSLVGLGRIGSRVAHIARHGLAMNVRAYDPFVSKAGYSGAAELEESLETLLRSADILSLHVPLTPETRRLINAERLRMLRPTCRVVNTSRGGVIDEAALAQALRDGRIAGAALDVFEQEPLPVGHPFLHTPNTLLTPHISSSTAESMDRMARDAAQGVLDVLQGRLPAGVVNPEVFQ